MIRTRTDGDVRVVTLDRPEARNALRPADLTDLRAAFEEPGDDAGPDAPTTAVDRTRPAPVPSNSRQLITTDRPRFVGYPLAVWL